MRYRDNNIWPEERTDERDVGTAWKRSDFADTVG